MSGFYYTYIIDENGIVFKMYEGLSQEQKKEVYRQAPFGFSLVEYNKPIQVGGVFPRHRQEVTVKNICNIVVFGGDINVRI